jgi:hypothetical protein
MYNNKKSPLRRLPLVQQRRLIHWLQNHTVAESVEFIASEFHMKVSNTSVANFRSWWYMSRSLELAAEFADTVRETLTTDTVSREQRDRLQEAAQIAFEMAAIERQDLAAFVDLRKLRQRDQAIEIARQRCQSATTARENALSHPSVSEWSEQDRQAVICKVDEVFGISQEPSMQAQPPANPPPCVQNPPNPPNQ